MVISALDEVEFDKRWSSVESVVFGFGMLLVSCPRARMMGSGVLGGMRPWQFIVILVFFWESILGSSWFNESPVFSFFFFLFRFLFLFYPNGGSRREFWVDVWIA